MKRRPIPDAAGFTIMELMVSISLLVVLLALVMQMTDSTTLTTTGSRKHLDADSEARTVFDLMSEDFDRMVKRPDVDILFSMPRGAGGASGSSDAMFFFSEAPAFFDPATQPSGISSPLGLIGYRINSNYQLERLSKGLNWDNTDAGGTANGVIYLSYPNPATSGTGIPDPGSTIAGVWGGSSGSTIGTEANSYSDGVDATDYHVVGPQVFRMEISFLRTDGITSQIPVTPSTPTGIQNYPSTYGVTTTISPSADDDSAGDGGHGSFQLGSRWYNSSTQRGYICVNDTSKYAPAVHGSAQWAPIGLHDVSAIIVDLAILDNSSRKLLPAAGLNTMAEALADASDNMTGAQAWTTLVQQPHGYSGAFPGVPVAVAGQVRFYERYFYLNYIPR
ncbi:MAG TPA: hypothetical protein VHY22_08425 [Chthoniobacteraceae bacterium]|jgi:hypothetical protein|nr:hypothetical protein [Chthoniobacteraceae bacterium]